MDRSALSLDRRRAARRDVATGEPLAHARLRTGGRLCVIDASGWGVLTETGERLLPGRQLDVHIVSVNGRVLVRARVARAYVHRLAADAIQYRAALAFDQAIDVRAAGYPLPAVLLTAETPPGTTYPDRALTTEIAFIEPPSP